MNGEGLIPGGAAGRAPAAFSAGVGGGFGPFTRRSPGAFVGRAMHRPAASFLRSKNTSGYPDQDTAGLVKALIKCRGNVLPDGRTAHARFGERISAHYVILTGPLSPNPTHRKQSLHKCALWESVRLGSVFSRSVDAGSPGNPSAVAADRRAVCLSGRLKGLSVSGVPRLPRPAFAANPLSGPLRVDSGVLIPPAPCR